jgi:hypothetical protein
MPPPRLHGRHHRSVLSCAALHRVPPKPAPWPTVSPTAAICPVLSTPAHPFFSSVPRRSQPKSPVTIGAIVAAAVKLDARPTPNVTSVSASTLMVTTASMSLPLILLCAPHAQVANVVTSRHRERRVRCLHRLDVVGENLPLPPRHCLAIHVLESCRHVGGRRRPQSSASATCA